MASFTITGTTTTGQVLADGETGFVGVNGAIADQSGDAIDATGSVKITILGAVQAFAGQAIDLNTGTDLVLDVGSSGYLGSSSSDTVNAQITGSALINNYGVIQSDSDALDIRDTDGSALIRINNHGTISGNSDGLVLQSGSGTTTLINTGVISGQSYGVFNAFTGQSGVTLVNNSGTITGLSVGYGGDDSTEIIVNSGEIIGGIDLDGGNDIYRGALGRVDGLVTGEDGDDTMIGGDYADEFSGGVGDDVLRGRGARDELTGGDGNDDLRGGGANDRLTGGSGRDLLFGQSGDDDLIGDGQIDELRGGTGEDTLDGGAGRDILFGGRDDDMLFGGAGDDRLEGGGGDDQLVGQANADTFVFGRNTGDDRILDFTDGEDLIDLTAFGLRPIDFPTVQAALSSAGPGNTFLDFAALGGSGSVLIEGLGFNFADATDFIL